MESVELPLRSAPALGPGEVHVWFVRPQTLGLPPTGSTQARQERLQQQFLLRLLLGCYLGVPGRALRLGRSIAGKPYLAEPPGALQFSQSDSGDWLSIALARDLTLGIDIESGRRAVRAAALARRWFSSAEAHRVRTATDPGAEFLRRWTAREAMIKAMGETLASCLGSIELDSIDADRPRLLPGHWPGPDRWSLLRPDSPETLQTCLACCPPPRGVRSFLLKTCA